MAAPQTKITGKSFVLSVKLEQGVDDTTITVSKPSTTTFTASAGTLKIGTGTRTEWATFTGATVSSTSIIFTGVKRGLKTDASSLTDNDLTLAYEHAIGQPVVVVDHSANVNKYVQKDADDTISGSLNFTSTTVAGLRVPSLTTAQRDALTGTLTSAIIRNSTTDVFQVYLGGTWYDLSNGSTTIPVATTLVAGRQFIDTAPADPAAPTSIGNNSTRALDTTTSSAARAIRIAKETTGSRTATLSLHGDDTYTSGAAIFARGSGGANTTTTLTHRGTGEFILDLTENANLKISTTGALLTPNNVYKPVTLGMTVAVGEWVYIKASDGRAYQADNTTVEKATVYGVVASIVSNGAAGVAYVQTEGIFITSGLTANTNYWVNSAGTLTTTAPTINSTSVVPVVAAYAMTTTLFYIVKQRIPRQIIFTGQRTAASGSGSQSVTIGVNFNNVTISAQRSGNGTAGFDTSVGFVDAVAGTSYTYNDATKCISLLDSDGSGTATATGAKSGTNLALTWTFSLFADNVNFCGMALEAI